MVFFPNTPRDYPLVPPWLIPALRLGLLNLGSFRKKEGDAAETLAKRGMGHFAVLETRWNSVICKSQNRFLTVSDSRYKFFWAGNREGKGGIGTLLAECWVANVSVVVRISDKILLLKLAIGKDIYTIISVYDIYPWSNRYNRFREDPY